MLAVLYLIFNEGYAATAGEALVRRELCAEAIRLAKILVDLMPDEPEVLGLLGLMLTHDARRDARMSRDGELVPLEEQDRTKWDRGQQLEAMAVLQRALARGQPGSYQIQAAIAGLHGASRAEDTDWRRIAELYGELVRYQPTPVVQLNRGVAIAMAEGPERGLAFIDRSASGGELNGYYLFHAARADLLRRLGRNGEAGSAYGRALELVTNDVERRFLERRLREVRGAG